MSTLINESVERLVDEFKLGNYDFCHILSHQILKIQKHSVVYHILGLLEIVKKNYKEAESFIKKAIEIKKSEEFFNSLAGVYKCLEDYDKSEQCFLQAIEINPDFIGAYSNLSLLYFKSKNYNQAMIYFKKTFELISKFGNYSLVEFSDIAFNYAHLLLLNKDYENGWKYFEYRWNITGGDRRNFDVPYWNGEKGRVCVIAEQGYGDMIMFGRYLSLIKPYVDKLIFECPSNMHSLFSKISCIDELIIREEFDLSHNRFDYFMPLLSVPRLLNTTVDNIPKHNYISCDFKENVKLKNGFNVGICYATGKFQQKFNSIQTYVPPKDALNNQSCLDGEGSAFYRSCPIDFFHNLLDLPCNFYSLQKGECLDDGLIPLRNYMNDWSDTASLIQQLDLIITVDTSILHLAGSMGKQVWLLLPNQPDWKYGINDEKCLWYDNVKIFRQSKLWDWQTVIDEIKPCLQEVLDQKIQNDKTSKALF